MFTPRHLFNQEIHRKVDILEPFPYHFQYWHPHRISVSCMCWDSILPSLQATKLPYFHVMVAIRRHEAPEAEPEGFMTHRTQRNNSMSFIVWIRAACAQVLRRGWREGSLRGPGWILHLQNSLSQAPFQVGGDHMTGSDRWAIGKSCDF